MHANNLEAEHIGEVLDLLRKRGYRFIPLGQALSDAVYSLPDDFVAEGGGKLDRTLGDHHGQTAVEPAFGAERHARSCGGVAASADAAVRICCHRKGKTQT